MVRYLLIAVITTFSFISAQTESKVTIRPEKPRQGNIVHILFNPGTESPLLNADSVLFQGKFYKIDGGEVLDEFLMNKTDTGYEFDLDLKNGSYNCVVFQFSGKKGEPIDCNKEKAWDFFVFDSNGNPLKYAYYNLSESYKAWPYPLKRERDNKVQLKFLEEEYKRTPDDFKVNYSLVLLKSQLNLPGDNEKLLVQKHLDSLMTAEPEKLDYIYKAMSLNSVIKDNNKYQQLLEKAKKLDKSIALGERRNRIFSMPDKKAKADTIIALYKLARGTRLESAITQDVVMLGSEAVDFKRYVELTKDLKDPEMESLIFSICRYSSQCSKNLLAAKDKSDPKQKIYSKDLKEIENRLLETMEKYTNEKDKKSWDNFPSRKQYARKRAVGIGFISLGEAEYAMGDYDKSIRYFETAEKLIANDDYFYFNAITPFVKALVESTIKTTADNKQNFSVVKKLNAQNERIQKAIKYSLVGLEKYYTEDLAKLAIQIESKLSVKSEALSSQIKGIAEKHRNERQKEVEAGYKKNFSDAPDFTVKDFSGKVVKLSDLRGKIVILDFWATTCGYCLQSFKYLEKFLNAHKNDKDIYSAAINLDVEVGASPATKLKFVKEFLKKNKFNLNYLMDYGNTTSPLYQINGIPVIIVIGPDGKIYFREDGFGGDTLDKDIEYIINRIRKEKN